MKKNTWVIFILILLIVSFKKHDVAEDYMVTYSNSVSAFEKKLEILSTTIEHSDLNKNEDIEKIRTEINSCRTSMKEIDIWLRYLDPISYKRINGPLPVEWETEVFEKFEKPYKREGAGLTLAYLYLDENKKEKEPLIKLIKTSLNAVKVYKQDSLMLELRSSGNFYLCNRLFLLNLATIYTTGFECPDTERIVDELQVILIAVSKLNKVYNSSYPYTKLSSSYLRKFEALIEFVKSQPRDFSKFDHFSFVKDHVNPLFSMNQQFIREYNVKSKSYVDYSLTNESTSIFSKTLYNGQDATGIFSKIEDPAALKEVEELGKLLFYDPILSGNNLRSCASCHAPSHFFTDTLQTAALQFNKKGFLARNTPSLLNSNFNHLLMLDGMHTNLQNQAKAVITSSLEMGASEQEAVEKVMSCEEYAQRFVNLLKYTPGEKEVSFDHICSALTLYYSKFSMYDSPFDDAINTRRDITPDVKFGYNLFMSKAQCATCHFAPQFNGVKPPYVGSEFEVLGVPEDTTYKTVSKDKGRYFINPSIETSSAFRTGTVRNAEKTKPYMHNGVFKTMDQLIDFYDCGGGAGRGLYVPNQTLSSDSLHLTKDEKKQLMAFISSLNEKIQFDKTPEKLPLSKNRKLNSRKPGGEY